MFRVVMKCSNDRRVQQQLFSPDPKGKTTIIHDRTPANNRKSGRQR